MAPAIAARLRSFALLCTLVLVSFGLGHFALSLIFFRVVLPNIQLNIRPYLPETAGVLVQTSKARFVPKDYVAILGDSYAEGLGDWLLTNAGNEALAYHSAHIIRDLTGKDVVTFAKAGSGSAEALVRQPARIMAGSGCAIFPDLEQPKHFLAYFYEGNDVPDNLHFRAKVAQTYGGQGTAEIDRYLSEQYGVFAGWRCHLYLGDVMSRMVSYLVKFFFNPLDLSPRPPGGNVVQLADKTFDAPAPLHGPALTFNDAEIASGVEVFERSLVWLQGRFKDASTTVVYVPAALSIYRLATAETDAARIARNSDMICGLIRDAALRHGTGFIDTRPTLRAAAATRLIHGPLDWDHFNKDGYLVLGGLLAQRMQQAPAADPCK